MASEDSGLQNFFQNILETSHQSDGKPTNQGHSRPSQSSQVTPKPQTDAEPQHQGPAPNQPPSYGDSPIRPTPRAEAPNQQSEQTEPTVAPQQGQKQQSQIGQIPPIVNRFTEDTGKLASILSSSWLR